MRLAPRHPVLLGQGEAAELVGSLPKERASPSTSLPPGHPARSSANTVPRPTTTHDGSHTLAAIQSLAYIIVTAIFVVAFSLQPFRIPSASMEPTLLVGDFLLVNKLTDQLTDRHAHPDLPSPFPTSPFPPSSIHRGDVVVFFYPVDPSLHLVKRVIGLPGDRLRLRDGRVFLNGSPLDEPYAVYTPSHADPFRDNFPHLQSTDPDVDARWWMELHRLVDHGELRVPPGKYFVLGDNRNDSEDSRYWGLVPQAAIVGKPFLVYFSLRNSPPGNAPADAREAHVGPTPANPHRNLAQTALDLARWHRVLHIIR